MHTVSRNYQTDHNKIEAILLCQFYPQQGPRIVYQHPPNYLTTEFKLLQVYLLPKEGLARKLITVKAFDHRILGCPYYIQKNIYKRNNFIFNICLVFKPNSRTTMYEPVLKKLIEHIAVLEAESGYLSLAEESGLERFYEKPEAVASLVNKKFQTSVSDMLKQVRDSLNSKSGQATINIDEANIIDLKVVMTKDYPREVKDHDVPVLNINPAHYVDAEWDLTTRAILPYIDGVRHVSAIANEVKNSPKTVRTVIRNLLFVKMVRLICIFQFSNIYKVTREIETLYNSKDLQNECMKAVALRPERLPSLDDIMKIYSSFTHASMSTVRLVCTRHRPDRSSIDVRKLIQFGLIKKIIRRIHKYPVRLSSESESSGSGVIKYCDGLTSYDVICTATGFSYAELDAKIEADPNIAICWK